SELGKRVVLTQTHAILGSGVRAHVDLHIGSLPLRLISRDSALLSAASRRYEGFQQSDDSRFSIVVDREPAFDATPSQFACDFEGAKVVADFHSAHFSGVRHEFALDSLLRMFLSWALLPRDGFLLHAASVVRDGKAYVFVGRSGA